MQSYSVFYRWIKGDLDIKVGMPKPIQLTVPTTTTQAPIPTQPPTPNGPGTLCSVSTIMFIRMPSHATGWYHDDCMQSLGTSQL